MRKSTIVGLFVGMLALTMNAQVTQPSNSKSISGTTNVEMQKKPVASLQELLARYQNLGKRHGAVSEYFSQEEQRILRSYFSSQAPANSRNGVSNNTGINASRDQFVPLFVPSAVKDNSEQARKLVASTQQRAAQSAQRQPLFLAPEALTSLEQQEVFAASQQGQNVSVENTSTVYNRNPLAAIIPTAGATETFAVSTGDFFYDPSDGTNGGPGGDCSVTSSGDPGDYPNCGCVTTTTLTGTDLSVEFLSFRVFGNFDFLNIYDGPDTSSPQLYDSNLNATTDELAGMIAANGSAIFTSTSGALTFEFNATAVVNTCGWEVEVLSAGGGGGGGAACAQDHPFGSVAGGGSGSSVDSTFKTAADIVVAAGEDFVLDTIEVPFLTFAPEDPPITANIVYYDDAGGLPGAVIGSETVVPTILSSGPWANPIAFQFMTSLAVTPFTFDGDAGSDTTYWIEVSMGTATNQGTVFWEYTDDIPVEGEPYAKFDSTVGTWAIDDPAQEVVYTFSGQCEPIGGGGPGPLTTVYGINNSNQDLIGFGVASPGTTEVFGTSPITVNFENAGAIDPANPTTGYVLDNGGQFYSFDVVSGFYTLLGNIPGDWVGMEFDRTTGTLYAIQGADLYTIDPVAISSTLVGATGINPSDLPIALAIDGAGVGYTYELVNQTFYSIDLATATATAIGNIGFDANFGQGMCYDPTTDMVYMAAFNGTTFAAEWRSVDLATGNTTLIGPIVTPEATTQVAWASIGETLPPPACPEPTNLAVTNIAADSADLSWDAEPNASNGYIWYVFLQGDNPMTDPPVATGTVPAGTTTATATGLDGGLSYDFYVVADCDSDGLSQLAGPVSFATPPACGGKFYDTGGPTGDYQNSENVTTTITPVNPGEQVTVTFTAFDVEANWDALYVYDGPDASSPLISSGNPPTNSGFPAGGFYGTSIPGPFTSSHPSGALTFVFMSDSSVPRAGWEADVTCALSPPPNDMIVNSIDVDEIGFPYTDPGVHMPAATVEDGNPSGCDLTGANGVWYNFVPEGDGTATASITTPGGASSVTFYTAPDENATETDLVLVPQNSNQCVPGTSASISTVAGQAYYVFVLNTGAITDIVIDGTNLGVSENSIAGFSYYPNPTTGVLNLRSVDNIEQVSLYNLLGQRVMDNTLDSTAAQVDISGLSSGTYIMKVTVNGQIGTYKVLKD